MTKPFSAAELRAAKVSRLPGVTIEAAAKRFRVTTAAVKRARREAVVALAMKDVLIAALTNEGRAKSGELGDLGELASYLDYVNHDGSRAEDVRVMLDGLVRDGVLSIEGTRWTLITPWP